MAAGVVWWAQGRQSAGPGSVEAPVVESTSGLSAAMRAMPGLGAGPSGPNPWATAASAPPTSPLDHVAAPVFKANARGGLLMDSQAGVDMERLNALYERDQALEKIAEATQGLPPQAQREARELHEQHAQYSRALSTAIGAPSESPTLDEARQQLKVLKDLRAQYFGERAESLFGQEEALQQRLLDDAAEAMRTQKLSLEEAVGQAQAKMSQEMATTSPRR